MWLSSDAAIAVMRSALPEYPVDRAARVVHRAGDAQRPVGVDKVHLRIDQQQNDPLLIVLSEGRPLASPALMAASVRGTYSRPTSSSR